MSWTVTTPVLVVAALLIVDVYCGDVSYLRNSAPNTNYTDTNAWSKVANQHYEPSPQWGSNRQGVTTPWPALVQRYHQNQNPVGQNTPSNPTWVRPRYQANFNLPNFAQNPFKGSFSNFRTANIGPSYNGGNPSPQEDVPVETRGRSSNGNGGQAEDYELREFSEELLTKDINNAARHVTVNYQGKTTSRSEEDNAPQPLLSVSRDAFSISTVDKLSKLYDNYIIESNVNEQYTSQERNEENTLLDAVISTPVMVHTRNFLIEKGVIGRDPREFKDILQQIWFNQYSRGRGKVGSSGFEHVFLAEIKNGQISGLHNWLYFHEEEKLNRVNYLGYLKKIDLGNKGAILKYHFNLRGIDKPVGSMFIGTSPEFEMALYTTCFLLRADRVCPLKLDGNRFIIRTYTYNYQGKKLIGSAFPEI